MYVLFKYQKVEFVLYIKYFVSENKASSLEVSLEIIQWFENKWAVITVLEIVWL